MKHKPLILSILILALCMLVALAILLSVNFISNLLSENSKNNKIRSIVNDELSISLTQENSQIVTSYRSYSIDPAYIYVIDVSSNYLHELTQDPTWCDKADNEALFEEYIASYKSFFPLLSLFEEVNAGNHVYYKLVNRSTHPQLINFSFALFSLDNEKLCYFKFCN